MPLVLALILVLSLGSMAGCTHVIRYDGTPYFKDGPEQVDPPDGTLSAGTGVWVIGEKIDYKRVWTADFVIAYVWERDLVTQWEWWEMERERKAQAKREEEEERERRSSPVGQS